MFLTQLVIGVLGTLVITSEYSTGMIRTSLTVLPRRGLLVAAKAVVFAAVAFVTGLICSFASFFTGQAIMSSNHTNTTLGHPDVLRAVIGGALFLTVCGLLAFGIGLLIRHTAGAVTAVAGVLFVLPIAGKPAAAQLAGPRRQVAAHSRRGADLDGQPRAARELGVADRRRRTDVRPVDRLRGVLRVRGHRARRRADPVPQAGRVSRRSRAPHWACCALPGTMNSPSTAQPVIGTKKLQAR